MLALAGFVALPAAVVGIEVVMFMAIVVVIAAEADMDIDEDAPGAAGSVTLTPAWAQRVMAAVMASVCKLASRAFCAFCQSFGRGKNVRCKSAALQAACTEGARDAMKEESLQTQAMSVTWQPVPLIAARAGWS